MEPSFIFHIISKSDYEQAQAAGEWRAPSLATVRETFEFDALAP